MTTALVIDDDPDYRKLLGEILRNDSWQVLEAEDGEQGIQLAKTHRPAVVVCDLLMARANGFQVCRTLRRLDSLETTRIVVTSGREFASDRQAALEAGADEYFTKPVEPADLLAALKRLARVPQAVNNFTPPASDSASGLRVKFWGVRGSIPTPGPTTLHYGGNTSCVEVRFGNQIIILDAGTGLRLLGRELIAEFGEQPLDLTLLLTHTHWDHIQGLPFFL